MFAVCLIQNSGFAEHFMCIWLRCTFHPCVSIKSGTIYCFTQTQHIWVLVLHIRLARNLFGLCLFTSADSTTEKKTSANATSQMIHITSIIIISIQIRVYFFLFFACANCTRYGSLLSNIQICIILLILSFAFYRFSRVLVFIQNVNKLVCTNMGRYRQLFRLVIIDRTADAAYEITINFN